MVNYYTNRDRMSAFKQLFEVMILVILYRTTFDITRQTTLDWDLFLYQ